MDLREVLIAVRSAWWFPLAGLIVGGGVALMISLLQIPLYTSTTQLFVSTTDNSSTTAAFEGSQFSEQRVMSYAQLLTGQELASRVVNRLNLDLTASQVSGEITATAVTNTVLINVSVTDPSPQRAQQIATTLGNEFTQYAAQLEAAGPQGSSPVKVTVTQRPVVPRAPTSPNTHRNVALGLVAGLLLGAAVAIAKARLDRTVKDSDELTELAGTSLIGTVLDSPDLQKQHVLERNSAGRAAEDFRQLRTNLQFVNVDEPPKMIMVSSAVPSEGKTTVVVNLALALADAGKRVTIVEADLRRPKVTRYLGLVGGAGLTNILARTAEIDDVVQTYRDNVFVIGSGPKPPNPGELLSSSHMADILDKLRGQNDVVLVDAPPLLPVADSTGLAVHMDGVLLSVRYGKTRKDQLRQAAAALDRVGAKKLGVILNIVPPKAEMAAAYGYRYSYGYEPRHGEG